MFEFEEDSRSEDSKAQGETHKQELEKKLYWLAETLSSIETDSSVRDTTLNQDKNSLSGHLEGGDFDFGNQTAGAHSDSQIALPPEDIAIVSLGLSASAPVSSPPSVLMHVTARPIAIPIKKSAKPLYSKHPTGSVPPILPSNPAFAQRFTDNFNLRTDNSSYSTCYSLLEIPALIIGKPPQEQHTDSCVKFYLNST